jgi:hypothetical protein
MRDMRDCIRLKKDLASLISSSELLLDVIHYFVSVKDVRCSLLALWRMT